MTDSAIQYREGEQSHPFTQYALIAIGILVVLLLSLIAYKLTAAEPTVSPTISKGPADLSTQNSAGNALQFWQRAIEPSIPDALTERNYYTFREDQAEVFFKGKRYAEMKKLQGQDVVTEILYVGVDVKTDDPNQPLRFTQVLYKTSSSSNWQQLFPKGELQ